VVTTPIVELTEAVADVVEEVADDIIEELSDDHAP